MIRTLALHFGIANLLAFVAGFLPWTTQPIPPGSPELTFNAFYALLLGLYPINMLHNFVHLAFGIGGVAVYRSLEASRRYWVVAGVILTLLTVLGLIPATATLGGFVPLYGHDIWLHAAEAVLAFYLGLVHGRQPAPVPATGR
jgi:hypothetical protein